jgi:hypothetical protein
VHAEIDLAWNGEPVGMVIAIPPGGDGVIALISM